MITHDIAEAISLADRIIVLSKRPAHIKTIYNIPLKENPLALRKSKDFNIYYEKLWRDLDKNV